MHTYFFAHFCGEPNVPPQFVPSTPVSVFGRHAVPIRSEKSRSQAIVLSQPHWVGMSHGDVAHTVESIIGESIGGASICTGGASTSRAAGGSAFAQAATPTAITREVRRTRPLYHSAR